MIRLALAIALAALASPAPAHERLIRVPFVGCPRDGQTGLMGGPIKPPIHGSVPRLPVRTAAQLAFYSSDDVGILAPRGWHCAGLYGSGGFQLVVSPEKITPGDFLRSKPRLIKGPVVEIAYSYGGTSGRFAVGQAIARYFPARRSFIADTKKLFDFDVFGPLPAGPYRDDRIVRRSQDFVRFLTPARRPGAGTEWLVTPSNRPVEGIRRLISIPDGPDLIGVNVRMPDRSLVNTILASAKVAK